MRQEMELRDRIVALERKLDLTLDLMSEALPVRRYRTLDDIEKEFGLSKSFIRKNLWAQPNFGIPDLPGKTKQWSKEAYEEWFSVPMMERKRQFDRMSFTERQRSGHQGRSMNHCGVEQMVARVAHIHQVVGSNPTPTKCHFLR